MTEESSYLAPIAVLKACSNIVKECAGLMAVAFPAVAAIARLAVSAILRLRGCFVCPLLSPGRSTTHVSANHENRIALLAGSNCGPKDLPP